MVCTAHADNVDLVVITTTRRPGFRQFALISTGNMIQADGRERPVDRAGSEVEISYMC